MPERLCLADDPQTLNPAVCGGKAAGLAKLAKWGQNVPAFFAIPKHLCEAFHRQAPDLPEMIADIDFSDPAKLAAGAAALRQRLAALDAAPFLPDLTQTLLDSGIRGAVSVRSSACFEDSAASAFAGAHNTYLNVQPEMIAERVKDCWLSLWNERALAYRKERGISLTDASMAVVVQAMVQADCAGVCFSIDPVSGNLAHVPVDANWGLGASVVDGSFEVDHWILDKATGQAISERIGDKSQAILAHAVDEACSELAPELARAPCLQPDQLALLCCAAKACEAAAGWPQDLEWAFQGGTLFILQARPITSIAPVWTRDESAERFPNPITPLAWDLVEEGFHQSLNHSFRLMGLPEFDGKWFANKEGYIYGNQSAVALYAERNPIPAANTPEQLAALVPALREKFSWVQDLPTSWHMGLDQYLLELGRHSAQNLEDTDLHGAWRHLLAVRDTARRYFLPNIAISLAQRGLYKTLHAMLALLLGKENAPGAFDALLAVSETKTSQVNRALRELARRHRDCAALLDPHNSRDIAGPMRAQLEHAAPAFYACLDEICRLHGHRENEFDPYWPTWGAAAHTVVDLARALAMDADLDLEHSPRDAKIKALEIERQISAKLPQNLAFFFFEVLRLARAYTSLDDLEHYQTTRVSPALRAACAALGSKLAQIIGLGDPLDVFFASFQTLRDAIERPCASKWQALADQIRAHKEQWEQARRREPDWVFGQSSEPAPCSGQGAASGIPGAPGKITAPAFLVHSPEDFALFPKGAVLVARTTNPAWTPLFTLASGIVTASGGPLSHGAVTARELGLPAVMAVRGAMDLFRNGQILEVDGSRGLVTPADKP